ncbi:hypothetical protein ES708_24676 [subsurface metagenome]
MEQEAFGEEEQAGGFGAVTVGRVELGDFLDGAIGSEYQAVDAKNDVSDRAPGTDFEAFRRAEIEPGWRLDTIPVERDARDGHISIIRRVGQGE